MAEIKPVMSKEGWQKLRPSCCKASKVGKALNNWPTSEPSTLDEVKNQTEACNAILSALDTAMKKLNKYNKWFNKAKEKEVKKTGNDVIEAYIEKTVEHRNTLSSTASEILSNFEFFSGGDHFEKTARENNAAENYDFLKEVKDNTQFDSTKSKEIFDKFIYRGYDSRFGNQAKANPYVNIGSKTYDKILKKISMDQESYQYDQIDYEKARDDVLELFRRDTLYMVWFKEIEMIKIDDFKNIKSIVSKHVKML